MNSLDYKIINVLTADRVRRLEEQGLIKGYTALVDAEILGTVKETLNIPLPLAECEP